MFFVIRSNRLPDGQLKKYLDETMVLLGSTNPCRPPERICYNGRFFNYGVRPVVPLFMRAQYAQFDLYHLAYEDDLREADMVIPNDGVIVAPGDKTEDLYGEI